MSRKKRDKPHGIGPFEATLELAMTTVPMTVVTIHTIKSLAAERGCSKGEAAAHIYGLAMRHNRPLAIHYPTGKNTSRTLVYSPPGWTEERLKGYVAGCREELQALFGAMTISATGTL